MLSMNILGHIIDEVGRQRALRPDSHIGNSRWTSAARLAILTEEVGEVAGEVTAAMDVTADADLRELQVRNLRAELVQVAACAAAWIQAIDDQEASR